MSCVERDLLGHPIQSHASASRRGVRKVGYAAPLATGPKGQRCGTCKFAQRVTSKNVTSHKCELMAVVWSRGEASDINLRAPACRRWERKPYERKEAA